jgi:hypothetical protein
MVEKKPQAGKLERQVDREAEVWELRKQRFNQLQIAQMLGCRVATVYADLTRVTQRKMSDTDDSVSRDRQLDLESLDQIERIAMQHYQMADRTAGRVFRVLGDDDQVSSMMLLTNKDASKIMKNASDTIIKCKIRRAALRGMDAPKKHLVEMPQVEDAIHRYNQLFFDIVNRFVSIELRPQLSTVMRKAAESANRSIKPVESAGF